MLSVVSCVVQWLVLEYFSQNRHIFNFLSFGHRVMDYRSVLTFLVLITLICYFVNSIITAKEKWEAGKIALLIRKITVPTIQGFFCYHYFARFISFIGKEILWHLLNAVIACHMVKWDNNNIFTITKYPAITACLNYANHSINLTTAHEDFSNGPRDILFSYIHFHKLINEWGNCKLPFF